MFGAMFSSLLLVDTNYSVILKPVISTTKNNETNWKKTLVLPYIIVQNVTGVAKTTYLEFMGVSLVSFWKVVDEGRYKY